jgi:hypothetical protein
VSDERRERRFRIDLSSGRIVDLDAPPVDEDDEEDCARSARLTRRPGAAPSTSRRPAAGGRRRSSGGGDEGQLGVSPGGVGSVKCERASAPPGPVTCLAWVVAGRDSVIPSPFVVQVQYPVGKGRCFGGPTRVGIVPNCLGIRIRAVSPRHIRPVMNGEGGSGWHSQRSRHDRTGDQLLHRSPRSRLDSVKQPCRQSTASREARESDEGNG